MDMVVTFPGGMRVDAKYKDFTIKTDQAKHNGGEASEPAPFDLFLASLATCAGIFVVFFCEKRNIPTDNIRLIQHMEAREDKKGLGKIALEIEVPPDFPEKYYDALTRAVSQCSVKKVIENPPEFEIRTVAKKLI